MGALACLLGVAAIATPSWYRRPTYDQIIGLWDVCTPSVEDRKKIICVNLVNYFIQQFPDAKEFHGPQILAVVSLLLLGT